jgi:autotransporter-associated beta strand protein
VDAAGAWSNPANWLGGVPNGEGDVATFGNVITANRTITVDAPFTVGRINFADNNSYILGGSAPNGLRFDGRGNRRAVISVGPPTVNHTISAPMTPVSSLDVVNATNFAINLNGVTSGAGGLSLAGPVRFNGNNSFTGPTFISGGPVSVITVNSANALGATSAGTTVTDRASVNFANEARVFGEPGYEASNTPPPRPSRLHARPTLIDQDAQIVIVRSGHDVLVH